MSFVTQASKLLVNYHFANECSNQVMKHFYKLYLISVKRLLKGYIFFSSISLVKGISNVRMQLNNFLKAYNLRLNQYTT